MTAQFDGLDFDPLKPRSAEIAVDRVDVVVSEGQALVEGRGLVLEHLGEGGSDDLGREIASDLIPYCKQISAAGAKNAPRFSVATNLIREEHHSELADDEIETFILKR